MSTDTRFFKKTVPFLRLGDVADRLGLELVCGHPDGQSQVARDALGDVCIMDVEPIDAAAPHSITFVDNPKYVRELATTQAGAVILSPRHQDLGYRGPRVLSTTPYKTFAQVAMMLYPDALDGQTTAVVAGPDEGLVERHGAWVHASAQLGRNVRLGPGTVIGSGAVVGDDTVVGPGAVIGPGVVVGARGQLGPGVVLQCALLGDDVRVHSRACIGQTGFGFVLEAPPRTFVPQLGRVVIGNRVRIGAGVTIDRGALSPKDTIIDDDVMIDNLVHLAHGVRVGAGSVIVAQVGVSGSTTLGRGVVLSGQVGVTGHLTIGDGAQVAAQSGVMRDVAPGSMVGGSPAVEVNQWHRQTVALARLVKHRGA